MKDYKAMWEKLFEYVQKEEDKNYNHSSKAVRQNNLIGSQMYSASAVTLQKIRYEMEELED